MHKLVHQAKLNPLLIFLTAKTISNYRHWNLIINMPILSKLLIMVIHSSLTLMQTAHLATITKHTNWFSFMLMNRLSTRLMVSAIRWNYILFIRLLITVILSLPYLYRKAKKIPTLKNYPYLNNLPKIAVKIPIYYSTLNTFIRKITATIAIPVHWPLHHAVSR